MQFAYQGSFRGVYFWQGILQRCQTEKSESDRDTRENHSLLSNSAAR